MPPTQPKRAFLAAAFVAAPLTLITGLLFANGQRTESLAGITLLVLSFATAFVAAWFVHAVEAILFATMYCVVSLALLGLVVIGLDVVFTMHATVMWMFFAEVGGALVGIFARPYVRRL